MSEVDQFGFDWGRGLGGHEIFSDDHYWEDLTGADFRDFEDIPSSTEYPQEDHLPELTERETIFQSSQNMSSTRTITPPTHHNQRQQQQQQQQHYNFFDHTFSDSDSDNPISIDSSSTTHPTVIDLTDSPPLGGSKAMPKRRRLSGIALVNHERKRQRIASGEANTNSRSVSRQLIATPKTKVELVDLTDIEEETLQQKRERREKEALAAQLAREAARNPQKLACFECIICMENPDDMVVLYCGHSFCAKCLHESIEMSPAGAKCPICRTKIVVRSPSNGKESKQTFHHLEIKVKVSTKSGKRKA